jgi:hypothetical protein
MSTSTTREVTNQLNIISNISNIEYNYDSDCRITLNHPIIIPLYVNMIIRFLIINKDGNAYLDDKKVSKCITNKLRIGDISKMNSNLNDTFYYGTMKDFKKIFNIWIPKAIKCKAVVHNIHRVEKISEMDILYEQKWMDYVYRLMAPIYEDPKLQVLI